MDCSTPGLPVHHQLPEFTQTHVHWVSDAIQPSHPLLPLSPPVLNLPQHQGLFHWVNSSHHPWDSPGKNTGVGCHFLLQCIKVKSESEVAQLRPTPSGPVDCSQASPSLTSSKFRFLHGWVVLLADCTMYHRVSQWSARKFCHKFLEYTVSPEDWRALSVKTTQLNKTYGEIKAMHEQCSQGKSVR